VAAGHATATAAIGDISISNAARHPTWLHPPQDEYKPLHSNMEMDFTASTQGDSAYRSLDARMEV
jgi:hypothetical protein